MALLAQEFAEDAKEVEHFMTDARNPTDNEVRIIDAQLLKVGESIWS